MVPYSLPMPFVNLAASPPSRDTIHKSPAYEKTICVLLNVGSRINSGLFACADAAATGNRIQRKVTNTLFMTQSPFAGYAKESVQRKPTNPVRRGGQHR